MLRNYLKIAWRNLIRNKVYSAINIGGLAVGMAVAMLIGLWMYDELSFNKSFDNYDRIAQVMQNQTFNKTIETWPSMPVPMGKALRNTFGSDRDDRSAGAGPFTRVVLSSWTDDHIVAFGDRKFTQHGNYMEPEAPEMFTLTMLRGSRNGLKEPASILLSESVANAFFGPADPMGKLMRLDDRMAVKVTGVYQDLPHNSTLAGVSFIAPWQLHVNNEPQLKRLESAWGWNGLQVFVQLADNADLATVSARISPLKRMNISPEDAKFKPELFLQPMANWHLRSEFRNGVNTGGRIQFVWLFGIIGAFVLLLACINFINLSTARSEKRAKEVGIRKAVGSMRGQLISQFFSESFLVVVLAFGLSVGLVAVSLGWFNQLADKQMVMPWLNGYFWLATVGFVGLTGLLAGSYPALYLSGFQPVKVLKGPGPSSRFKAGRFAGVPRQVLVVVQFAVSVTLIIGTVVVYQQIQHARDRPIGYNRAGLLMIPTTIKAIHTHINAFGDELKKSGAITELATAESPMTAVWTTNGGFDWAGKDPSLALDFPTMRVSTEYGKTVGWAFTAGRDFSTAFPTDSSGFVLNEAAVTFMGLKKPIGETIRWDDRTFKVLGVIKDMITDSPYQPVRPTIFCLDRSSDNFIIAKLNPNANPREAVAKIETVFKRYSPAAPFEYQFVDQEYARKFGDEERIGNLALVFTILAIFISCLGLFGLASFMAEARTKEIGVRKVLGASVLNLWGLLSKDFVVLVVMAVGIAMPIAYYFLNNWLQRYQYRTEISWWVFALSGTGALVITLLTVSFQSVKAALMNPVKSLRSE